MKQLTTEEIVNQGFDDELIDLYEEYQKDENFLIVNKEGDVVLDFQGIFLKEKENYRPLTKKGLVYGFLDLGRGSKGLFVDRRHYASCFDLIHLMVDALCYEFGKTQITLYQGFKDVVLQDCADLI